MSAKKEFTLKDKVKRRSVEIKKSTNNKATPLNRTVSSSRLSKTGNSGSPRSSGKNNTRRRSMEINKKTIDNATEKMIEEQRKKIESKTKSKNVKGGAKSKQKVKGKQKGKNVISETTKPAKNANTTKKVEKSKKGKVYSNDEVIKQLENYELIENKQKWNREHIPPKSDVRYVYEGKYNLGGKVLGFGEDKQHGKFLFLQNRYNDFKWRIYLDKTDKIFIHKPEQSTQDIEKLKMEAYINKQFLYMKYGEEYKKFYNEQEALIKKQYKL